MIDENKSVNTLNTGGVRMTVSQVRLNALEIALRTPGIKGADNVVHAAAIYEVYLLTGERTAPKPVPVSIRDLKLSERTKNVLASCEITEVEELSRMSDNDLIRLPNMGKASLLEIRRVQRELNLPFSQS